MHCKEINVRDKQTVDQKGLNVVTVLIVRASTHIWKSGNQTAQPAAHSIFFNSQLFLTPQHTMNVTKSDDKLRSNQFPYHLTTTPNLAKVPTALAKKKKDLRRNYMHSETPTTYMVVNFDEEFVESLPSEMPPILHVNDAKTRTIVDKIRKTSPERKDKLPRAPGLNTSYLLPKYVDPAVAAERLMFRRKDAGTQTDLNMNKMVFEGMTGYQNWTSEVVEPFLKELRKEVKAKRPQDVPSYIIRYCQAMQKGEAPPETIDVISPPV